jgi:DNA topoisomerase-1
MELLIVESPNKAKKIQQLLGGGYTVAASVGHIADLPVTDIGVGAPDFEPTLELTEKGKVAVAKLAKFVTSATHVWLATDPDREGEAIAAHLLKFLQLQDYKRITFHEITKDAITKALQNPRKINDNLYQAQKARRVIDRLVGYKVSPELSKLAGKPLSAGRVQSVALRLVVERERAIREFKVTAHFGVQLLLENNGSRWVATWDSKNFITEDNPYVLDRELAETIAKIQAITILAVEKREIHKKPPPPFITTTLQKAASLELGIDAAKTMQVAQKLFEEGLITYHRTDNPNLSDDCLPMLKSVLKNMGLAEDLVAEKNTYKARANAQEAHEAIRPTDFLADDNKA